MTSKLSGLQKHDYRLSGSQIASHYGSGDKRTGKMAIYINRKLVVDKGEASERTVSEEDLKDLQGPLIILGDPGLGKTKLTESLKNLMGGSLIGAGTFCRSSDPSRFLGANARIIIDGLDEVALSGTSAVDEILKKLSSLNYPPFIISCRAADWQGSSDRYKIGKDYGIEPVTLHLLPLSRDEAKAFLQQYSDALDPDKILEELDNRGLHEFYGNPLTLTLVAELAVKNEGLPESSADLLDRATRLLVREENVAHQRSNSAFADLGQLLDSAGAMFAHLLLSGSIGIANVRREDTPQGLVPLGDLADIRDAPLIREALTTRLFQSAGENRFIPFHRVIAEYLGARWLSKRLSNGLSQRRTFQLLLFAGGVPSALRGIHAWLAHFDPAVADRCIRNDPYGILRYSDIARLPLLRARQLLQSLVGLADEDPYFRSEDWGKRSVLGLARKDLADDIIELLRNPKRHVHLSSLLLEAIANSELTKDIAAELEKIVLDEAAAYVERHNAAQGLANSNIAVNWPQLLERLAGRRPATETRLLLEIVGLLRGRDIDSDFIADALLRYEGFNATISDIQKDDAAPAGYVLGVSYFTATKLDSEKSGDVLDVIASRIASTNRAKYSRVGYKISRVVDQLLRQATATASTISAHRLWSWIKNTDGDRSSSDHNALRAYFDRFPRLRREVQLVAFADTPDGPSGAIFDALPRANSALAVSPYGSRRVAS